jgi:PTS system nitrogen regulatory IIA component
MNVLTPLFTADCIVLNSPAKNKSEVFTAAAALFANQLNTVSADSVLSFLNAREQLGSTGLGAGVAIPHGRVKGLKYPCAAFIKVATPIEFAAPDQLPVNILVFLLVPEKATQEHLEILSAIAQLLSDPIARAALENEIDPEKVCQILRQWKT